jgi:hypothetical protein
VQLGEGYRTQFSFLQNQCDISADQVVQLLTSVTFITYRIEILKIAVEKAEQLDAT